MSIKRNIKSLMARYPSLIRPIWLLVYPFIRKDERYVGAEYTGSRSDTFTTIYQENRWGDGQSASGSGSTIEATNMLQSAFDAIVKETGAASILDAPCGDFNWMRHVSLPSSMSYVGGDIVAELIDDLQVRYAKSGRKFLTLDIVTDNLPAADIWLCRHVLMHLPNADVLRVLQNFARSKISFLLADNYSFIRRNKEIMAGGYRFINLRRGPFKLPPPLAKYPNSNPPSPPDYLCLWSRGQISNALARRAD